MITKALRDQRDEDLHFVAALLHVVQVVEDQRLEAIQALELGRQPQIALGRERVALATPPSRFVAFERYATGAFTLDTLSAALAEEGLRSRSGKQQLSGNTVWKILRNPFYMGIIRIERRGEHFLGIHRPLVSKQLFDEVQAVLDRRGNRATLRKHWFLFRRFFRCADCGHSLYGETKKGKTYYRCHSKTCRGVCLREERIEDAVREKLSSLRFPKAKERELALALAHNTAAWKEHAGRERERISLALGHSESRLMKLTDAFIDGAIEKEIFERRKLGLLEEQRALLDRKEALSSDTNQRAIERLRTIFELAKNAWLSYELANPEEKRNLVTELLSNGTVLVKNVAVELSKRYQVIAEWLSLSLGDPEREDYRTTEQLITQLLQCETEE